MTSLTLSRAAQEELNNQSKKIFSNQASVRLENVAEMPLESAVAQMTAEENPLIEFEKRLHKDAGLR